jgi:hypothetical protein
MLAIQTRSLQSYYLYTASNTIQPAEFIGNKVAGILFENKVDHTTFFGADIELIQGIHMLPLLPHTPLIRTSEFVREEWETYFSGGRADAVQGGWKGILYGNYATVDPRGAYEFFSKSGFDMKWVDGGASLTWYLCYAAGELFFFFFFFLRGGATDAVGINMLTVWCCSVGWAVRGFYFCRLVGGFLVWVAVCVWIHDAVLDFYQGHGR